MSATTTRIVELPDTNIASKPVNIQSSQSFLPIPEQNASVTTQQISNEFYGNISAQPQFPPNATNTGDENMQYQPINVHPNPYGTQHGTPEGPPLPEASPQRNQQMNYSVENMPHQTLPSRDIPMNTLEYQHDAEIKPNHVPSVKLTSDYIRDYERANEEELKLHRQNLYRQETAQSTIGELQVPILVAVLYFIFQIPIINTIMRKYLSFANLYNEDGNFNLSGLILKSIIFGGIFYSLQSIANKISNI